tara:strand:+ start:588 stop:914 length:327 start_codon:yes stop_codon:yes gene_type:complete
MKPNFNKLLILFTVIFLSITLSAFTYLSSSSGGGCHVYGKIKFVDYGEDYSVKFVDYGEDLRIKYVSYGEDEVGKWKVVDYGEDYKIKIVDYGEDYRVKDVEYGEGCD